MPPRIPGLESWAYLMEPGDYHPENIQNYEDCLLEIVDEYEIRSRSGPVPMMNIKIDVYKQKMQRIYIIGLARFLRKGYVH